MSIVKWIAALLFAAHLPLHAEVLTVHTDATGIITALNNQFPELGYGLPSNIPVTANVAFEFDTALATVNAGVFATKPTPYLENFDVTANGNGAGLSDPLFWGNPESWSWIRLYDNVRNAAGNLVDVFELHALGQTVWANTTYQLSEHLEFAAATFDHPDASSLLALPQARLLSGTLNVLRIAEGWDATFYISKMDAELSGFNVSLTGLDGPMPCVPEPGQYMMLLAGLAGAAAMRRRGRT